MKAPRPGKRKSSRGFSLLELLVVISLIALLAAATLPAISGIQPALNVTKAGVALRDQLLLARQLAITENAPVFACLYETPDISGTPGPNALALARRDANGSLEAMTRPARFPNGVAVSSSAQWSSLGNLETGNVRVGASSFPCRVIPFRPAGGTALSPTDEWFLTVWHAAASPEPSDNFVTVALDPVTGRVFSYQP